MIKWLKEKFRRKIAETMMHHTAAEREATRMCKHNERIRIFLNKKEEQVECLHCGLIKVFERQDNK